MPESKPRQHQKSTPGHRNHSRDRALVAPEESTAMLHGRRHGSPHQSSSPAPRKPAGFLRPLAMTVQKLKDTGMSRPRCSERDPREENQIMMQLRRGFSSTPRKRTVSTKPAKTCVRLAGDRERIVASR